MFNLLYHACLGLFLALPPCVLAIRFFKPKRMPWWLVAIIIPLASWVLVLGTVATYYEHLGVLIDSEPNPSDELMEEWASDGAKKVFALFFGWAYGLFYAVPWLALFGIAHLIRRSVRRSRPARGIESPN